MDLVICEIFNKKIHGFDDNNDPTVLGHYMVSHNFTKVSTDSEDDLDEDLEDDTDSEEDTDEDLEDDLDSNKIKESVFYNTNSSVRIFFHNFFSL